MVEGKYDLKLDTPIGQITGTLELKMINGTLDGYIETMGAKNRFTGGKVEGNKCAFEGKFNTPIGEITYEILGIVNGDNLDIYASTNKGRFKITRKTYMNRLIGKHSCKEVQLCFFQMKYIMKKMLEITN